jgi:hypothetical protein
MSALALKSPFEIHTLLRPLTIDSRLSTITERARVECLL